VTSVNPFGIGTRIHLGLCWPRSGNIHLGLLLYIEGERKRKREKEKKKKKKKRH